MAKRKKQGELPGMERPTIKELDTAAEHYVEKRDARMEASVTEKEAKDTLIAVMKKHKVDIYRDESANLVVTLVPGKDGVKVTEAQDDDEDEAA